MMCRVKDCIENENGYCMAVSYVCIDENGMCEEMKLRPTEIEEKENA